jgi:hypothetical protein
MIIRLSANAILIILSTMELVLRPYVIFNGLDVCILSFMDNDEASYRAITKLVNGSYVIE